MAQLLPSALSPTCSKTQAMWRWSLSKCPACGSGGLFTRYFKVADKYKTCGLEPAGHQAGDAPPDFTIFIVGHIVIPNALIVERTYQPPLFLLAAMFFVLSVIITLISLAMVKGAVVGLQWAQRMHGFADMNTTFVEETESQ